MRSSLRPTLSRLLLSGAVCGALAFAAPMVRADDFQKHMDAGVKLYREHKLDDALVEFREAQKVSTKDPNPFRWIGFVELERQNYEAARDPLERAVALDPGSVVAHLNLGNVYDGLKLYPKAIDEFRKVTKLSPDRADAYYDLGLTQSKLSHWTEAVDALRTAVKLDAAAVHPGNGLREDPSLHDALGYALINSGDPRGAAAAYQRAVTLAPNNAEFNYHLGLAWRRAGDDKKVPQDVALGNARRALKTATDLTPGNYEFAELYGEILFDLNSNAEAIEQFKRAADLDKSQYNPVYNLAVANTRLGQQEEAEKAYTRALALVKPGDDAALRRNALTGLTGSLYKQKKYDEAITSLKTFTTEYPTDTNGWVSLASSYRFKGDEAGQVEALRGAIANSAGYPNVVQLRSALGALLYRRGDSAGALEQYAIANRTTPGNADVLNGLALTEEKLRRYDDAIQHFQAAVRANPRYADAYNNLGVAYEARYRKANDRADLDRALAAYNQALSIDPNHPLARKNKERYDKSKRP